MTRTSKRRQINVSQSRLGNKSKTGARKKSITLSVSGNEIRYFVSVLSKSNLKTLRTKGFKSEAGIVTLSETLSGIEETTWIDPSSVVAIVGRKEIQIVEKRNLGNHVTHDFRGKDIVFIEHTIDNAEYHAKLSNVCFDDIRLEIELSETWILPDEQKINIYSLSITSSPGADLEYQNGGGGYLQGQLIMKSGKSQDMNEEEDGDSGEYVVKVN